MKGFGPKGKIIPIADISECLTLDDFKPLSFEAC